MSRIGVALVVGGALGILDGLTAWFTPEVRSQLLGIVIGSTVKVRLAGRGPYRDGQRGGTRAAPLASAGHRLPGICSASFASGTSLTLLATSADEVTFVAWSGDCSGAVGCSLTLARDAAVSARFE